MALQMDEAMEIERCAHQAELERRRRQWERRAETGQIMEDEHLSRQEREQRIWAFMCVRVTCTDNEIKELQALHAYRERRRR